MRRALSLVTLLALAASPALARVAPNPEGRFLRSPDGAVVKPGRVWAAAASPAAVAAVPVPLPAGAVLLDSTYYDLQDMGSIGRRIAVGPDGRVHATWQDDFCEIAPGGCPPNTNLPQPFPKRAMAYAWRDAAAAWQPVHRVQDPTTPNCSGVVEEFGGFGALALAPTGRVMVAQHLNQDGLDLRGHLYYQNAAGGSTYTAYLTPFASASSPLFPQVAAAANGSFTVLGEVPIGGSYEEVESFQVSVLAANTIGTLYTCFNWQGGAWTTIIPASSFKGNRPGFPFVAAGADGRVGVAVGDFGGNVFLVESSNGTFAPGTITIRNLTNYSDATITAPDSTSTQFRPFVHVSLAYNDTTPHVVWSELQARRIAGAVEYFDHRSRIMHWSSTRGISVVKQVLPGEADRYDDVDQLLSGPLGGFNTLSVDWPQVGFSADGEEIYVAWLRCVDAEVDPTADMGLPGIITGVGFADICASVARGAGAWSAPQNLTQTPQTDERFFSIAERNPGGRLHVLFQASVTNEAGCVVIGDRGASPGNVLRRIAYLEAPLGASLVDAGDAPAAAGPALAAWPNPARGTVNFRLAGVAGAAEVEVYSVDGRRVARVPAGRDGTARWQGRDARGRLAPAGLYFARVAGAGEGSTTRFMWLH